MGLPATVLPGYVPWTSLLTLPDMPGQDRTGYTIAHEFYFRGAAPEPVEIPYSWLSPPLLSRPDRPVTTATVTRTGGETVRAVDTETRRVRGQRDFPAELDTATEADPASLAQWALDFYGTPVGEVPRQRAVAIRLRLNSRAPTEMWRILDVTPGTWIRITGHPTRWPEGFADQVVEGIRHIIGAEARDVEWITSRIVGTEPGVPGPWFRWDYSTVDGTDLIPF